MTGLGLGFTNSGGTWESEICVLVAVLWAAWARVCSACLIGLPDARDNHVEVPGYRHLFR